MKIWIGLAMVFVVVGILFSGFGCNDELAGKGRAGVVREVSSFNGGWVFAKGEHAGAEAVEFDDSCWEAVRVPHDWAISGPFDANEDGYAGKLPWRGVGWYRKEFRLDEADAGRRVYFDFDGVMAFPQVYVNGELAGQWDYGYMSFRVDATEYVKFGGANVIAVRADTRRHGTRWYPGAGMYRKVEMAVCGPVHVGHWGTSVSTPKVGDGRATVAVASVVENHLDEGAEVSVGVELVDPQGKVVARGTVEGAVAAKGSAVLGQSLEVKDAKLWDVDDPQLYRARVTVSGGGEVLDTDEVRFGIRSFEFTADDGFHLNGRRVQLKGVNLHHDQGPLGAAFYRRAMERQLEIMQDMGCNAIRTSHNPPSEELLELCDEMGMVVWDECFDKWNETSDRGRGVDLVEHNKKQLRNFIMRDRNHPSVVTWSIGNEIADVESNRGGQADEQVKELGDYVRELDPTRPVGMGCFIPSAVGTGVLGTLDLTGWNYDRRYAPYREKYPEKPIVYSESASALSTRGFYELPLPTGKTDYSDAVAVDSYDYCSARWSDIADVEFDLMERDSFVAGEFVWTGFDYIGEPTPFGKEARSSYFGIVDLCGIPKDRFYLYRSYWRDDEVTVHILPHWNWEQRVGEDVPVFVYTNGDSAELFLNGKSLGRREKKTVIDTALNFANGGVARASSEEVDKGNVAGRGSDGDGGSRWCAADGNDKHWWEVDLGEVHEVRYLTIELEREASVYQYDVKASVDGESWETVVSKADWGNEGAYEVEVRGRYLRVEFTKLDGGWASIKEFGAYDGKVESSYYSVIDKYRLRWMDVKYEPGELRAVAYEDGREIGQAVMRTAGEAAAVRLTADRVELDSGGEDLSYVLVEAVDEAGTVCPLAENMVRFEVEGAGEIVGVGNGNPLSLEPFVAEYRKLFYGKAMVILRAKEGVGGKIRLTGSSDGLDGASIELRGRR